MKLRITTMVFSLAAILFVVLLGRYGFTVVKIKDVEKTAMSEAFNPVTYVDGIWDAKLLPTFNAKAVELPTILSQIEVGEKGTASKESLVPIAKKYGLITVGEAHVYVVKGSGKIVSVNTETSLGTVEVTLDGYSGPIKVLLYIGTRIPSDETSVRDGVGFINFGDFKEQTEYGQVTSEINQRVLTKVLGSLDKNNMLGNTITFQGAFTIRTFNLIQISLKEIKVVPIQIKMGD
jgi:predicted lipoprotein